MAESLSPERPQYRQVCISSGIPLLPKHFLNCKYSPHNNSAWGYVFDLTNEHFTEKSSLPLKHSYDVLAEECLACLDAISPPPPRTSPKHEPPSEPAPPDPTSPDEKTPSAPPPPLTPSRDLYALLRDNAPNDPKLQQLWDQVNTVPPWVDWAQISRGQDVFYRYGGAALTGLAYQSLLGGMGAARVVETLARTGGFSTKVARRRLFETTQYILQCTRSLEAIQPGGEGFTATVRVRFLHAAVRNRIMKLERERPGYYDVASLGVPINDFDSIATIATFSSVLIWLSFPRQGIWLRQQEIIDYIALWRYIAYVIGCPDEYFSTPARAKAATESIYYLELHPTPMSARLANNIIRALEDQAPGYASADMLTASARWMNGGDLCDALGLPRPGLYYYSLILGQCIFFSVFAYTYRSIPSWDRWKIDMLKRVFWHLTVEAKFGLAGEEAAFEFKYVPEYDTITHMNDGARVKRDEYYVEKRNLRWLLIGTGAASVVVGLAGWGAVRLVSGAVRLGLRALR